MNKLFIFTWDFFIRNIKYIVTLVVPFTLLALPSYVVSQPPEDRSTYITVVGLAVYVLWFSMFMSSLIFFMSQRYQDKLQPVKSNIFNGLIYSPLLIVTLLIANSPLIASAIIIAFKSDSYSLIHFPLLLVGVYVSLKSTFAPFHLILEGYNPFGAIKSSFMSTSGRIGKIIIVLLVFYLTTSITEALTTLYTNSNLFNFLVYFLGTVVTMLLVVLQQIAVFKLYINSFEEN